MVYSQDLEKLVLGGIIKYPDVYSEVSSFLSEEDFYSDLNKSIFSIIRQCIYNKEPVDKVIIGLRLKNLNISNSQSVDPVEYVAAISMMQATPRAVVQAVKDLKIVTARRNYAEVAQQIHRKMMKDSSMKLDEIIKYVDKEIYAKADSYSSSGDAIDLFESMYERIEEIGNNPVDDMGLESPFPCYNKRYGGFRNGNVYVFAARPKQGKTSFLNYTAFKMANNLNRKIPVLILDTEMQSEEVQERVLAMISGVPVWYITTGNWRKVPEFEKKIRAAFKEIKEKNYQLYHEYVIGTPVDEIVSKIKKWYYTKVGRGNQCVIIYDYLKITGEGLSEYNKEHQVIGEKVNTLKELVGKEIKAPLLTAVQINRAGDNRREAKDDSSVIAQSDRVLWFASQVSIFRRKTPEEIEEETPQFGTHKLINIESRWQGKEAAGHLDYVKNLNDELVNHFTNYSVNNFAIKEHGDAEEMFNALRGANPPIQRQNREQQAPQAPQDPFL